MIAVDASAPVEFGPSKLLVYVDAIDAQKDVLLATEWQKELLFLSCCGAYRKACATSPVVSSTLIL